MRKRKRSSIWRGWRGWNQFDAGHVGPKVFMVHSAVSASLMIENNGWILE